MPKHRSYRLLCPIARALDRVGDRWSLLVLRDLHAGPARFGDLASLPGLATNLLSARLTTLQDDGLIQKRSDEHGAMVYELTDDGRATAPLLFELAAFGSRFPPPSEIRRPGNLRTVAVTLKEALRRVAADRSARVELVVDDEPFAIAIAHGSVDVVHRADPQAPLSPPRRLRSPRGRWRRSLVADQAGPRPRHGRAREQAGRDRVPEDARPRLRGLRVAGWSMQHHPIETDPPPRDPTTCPPPPRGTSPA